MVDEITESRYKLLVVPEFKSTIPQPLLGKLSEQEKYLVETLSKMEQQNAWLITAVVEGNRINLEIDRRLVRLERWQSIFSGKWAVLVGIVILVGPVVLKTLVDLFLFHPR
jgi:hypothetical protein